MKDDDDIIDLTPYLERARQPLDAGTEPLDTGTEPLGAGTDRPSFSVFGGDGDRSRFALPIWRSIYLVGGRRGSLAWVARAGAPVPTAEFVLDLGSDPARTEFTAPDAGAADPPDTGALNTPEPPRVLESEDSVAVFLGSREEKNWFLIVDDYGPAGAVVGYSRGDLLFLAGECAGLLFFRELAEAGDQLAGE